MVAMTKNRTVRTMIKIEKKRNDNDDNDYKNKNKNKHKNDNDNTSSARTSRGRKFPKGKELYSKERICL